AAPGRAFGRLCSPRPMRNTRFPTASRHVSAANHAPRSTRWTPHEVRALLLLVGLGLGLGATVALTASVVWSPAELGAGALQARLGLEAFPCPGCALCGLSRGFAHLSRGRLTEAVELNALAPLVYAAALVC